MLAPSTGHNHDNCFDMNERRQTRTPSLTAACEGNRWESLCGFFALEKNFFHRSQLHFCDWRLRLHSLILQIKRAGSEKKGRCSTFLYLWFTSSWLHRLLPWQPCQTYNIALSRPRSPVQLIASKRWVDGRFVCLQNQTKSLMYTVRKYIFRHLWKTHKIQCKQAKQANIE